MIPAVKPASDLRFEPLTAARFDDLAVLFEEGGDPGWCWCTWFRFRGRSWPPNTAGHRTALHDLTEHADATSGAAAPGLLAYQHDRVVGWVSLGPREEYDRLTSSKV